MKIAKEISDPQPELSIDEATQPSRNGEKDLSRGLFGEDCQI